MTPALFVGRPDQTASDVIAAFARDRGAEATGDEQPLFFNLAGRLYESGYSASHKAFVIREVVNA